MRRDYKLTKIRLELRVLETGEKRLHGIQLEWDENYMTPFYKGIKTGHEMEVLEIDIDPTKTIARISFKMKKEHLVGMRLIDDAGKTFFR